MITSIPRHVQHLDPSSPLTKGHPMDFSSERIPLGETLQAYDTTTEVKAVSMDRFVIDGVLLSYLEDMQANDPEATETFRQRIREDDDFLSKAHNAAMDAVLYSSFANVLESSVFEESLTQLVALDEPELHRMREKMFDFGIELAARNVGGATTTGRLRDRAIQFHAATLV